MARFILALLLIALPSQAEETFHPDTIIFIGSSTMGHWKPRMEKDFAPLRTWNFGENGTDYTYLHENVPAWAKKYPAKRWVIYSGDNDLNSDNPRTPAQVNADMLKTAALIRQQIPGAEVFVLSIKCRVGAKTCGRVAEANQLMAKEKGITFVDTFTAMKKKAADESKLFQEDGIHLNDQGYDIWRDELRPALLRSVKKNAAPAPEASEAADTSAE